MDSLHTLGMRQKGTFLPNKVDLVQAEQLLGHETRFSAISMEGR